MKTENQNDGCDWAVEVAAQLWCKPEHGHKEMDVNFAMSIAAALRKAKADGMRGVIPILDDLPLSEVVEYVGVGEIANAIDEVRRQAEKIEAGEHRQ